MKITIKNIKQLTQILEPTIKKVSGIEMSSLPSIENAWLSIEGDKISELGEMKNYPSDIANDVKVIDANGSFVLPSWCDSHTHIVFRGSRELEFVDRIKGLSYEEIAKRGGGILNSAQKLHNTSEEELIDRALKRLNEIMMMGTGAVEIKSGYGLSVEDELKILRVIKKLKTLSPLTIKSTFLGAHAFPTEYKQNHEGYIKLIIDKMLPIIAEEKLAEYIDVFCEKNYFSEKETDIILQAGAKYGLKPKIHANQFNLSGGVQIGIKNKAISVDHLECIGKDEIELLKNSTTIPTLLPSCSFFIGIPYAPARKLIDSNMAVALASDYNPGSTPSGNIPFVISLACIKMKMLPEEAINAVTINGAYAMELSETHGSIAIGKKANIIITKAIPSLAYLPYSFGNENIKRVIINGVLQ